MNWRDVRILYLKELRSAARERTIVINGVLLPIFLYPVLLWLIFSGTTFVQGVTDGFESRVAVVGAGAEHVGLVDRLEADSEVSIVTGPEEVAGARDAIEAGALDAALEFAPPAVDARALAWNVGFRIHYDRAESRSRSARERVEEIVAEYRSDWLEDEARRLGMPREEQLQFGIVRRNVASDRDVGTTLMAQMVPIFLTVMVALGCLIPAIDATAGERERSTWETTLGLATSRLNLVASKYLYVATVGVVAGLLNVVAITVSIGAVVRPLLDAQGAGFEFSMPRMAVPVLAMGATGLALFFAAAMMILAAFARSFKDGQAMVAPVYWLLFVPVLMGDQTGQHLSPLVAAVPIANVTVMMRDAIQGVFLWPLIAEVVVTGGVAVGLTLLLARWILGFEDFLIGSHRGSFWNFVREKLS